MRALCTAIIASAVAVLLSACGGGSTKTVTVTTGAAGPPTTTATSTGTATAPPTPTTGTASTGGAATTTPPTPSPTATPATIVHLSAFRSPSGNIGCELSMDGARCDIQHRDWSPPPRPSSCQFDYGQGLQVFGSGRGDLVCAGDTALDPTGPVLAYGSGSAVGAYLCVSATTGMTCTDKRTGHGFSIAVQGYRVF